MSPPRSTSAASRSTISLRGPGGSATPATQPVWGATALSRSDLGRIHPPNTSGIHPKLTPPRPTSSPNRFGEDPLTVFQTAGEPYHPIPWGSAPHPATEATVPRDRSHRAPRPKPPCPASEATVPRDRSHCAPRPKPLCPASEATVPRERSHCAPRPKPLCPASEATLLRVAECVESRSSARTELSVKVFQRPGRHTHRLGRHRSHRAPPPKPPCPATEATVPRDRSHRAPPPKPPCPATEATVPRHRSHRASVRSRAPSGRIVLLVRGFRRHSAYSRGSGGIQGLGEGAGGWGEVAAVLGVELAAGVVAADPGGCRVGEGSLCGGGVRRSCAKGPSMTRAQPNPAKASSSCACATACRRSRSAP